MGVKTKVGLVQINNSFDRQCYLPYTVGILQAYAQRHLPTVDRFEFLVPIFKRIPVKNAVEQLREAEIVCFSTYVWNVRLSLTIAAALKQINPEVVTVFGGPQIPDREPEAFLREHPQVDLACHGEGERVFCAILDHLEQRSWEQVPSLSWIDGRGLFRQTELAPRITDFSEVPSPFLEGVFEPMLAAHPEIEWVGLWETNRGCPFTCAYCDWGSRTKNKVVARDIEEVYQEADWFSSHQIQFIFCCDANFSLLQRDLDIVRKVAGNKARTGYPKALSVQSTKNYTETSYAIYELMGAAGLNKGVSLSLQSVYPPTLEAIERKNIPAEVFREAQERLSAMKIETFTDIILPLPEETYDSFVDGIAHTMANGQHNRIQFNNLSILPNSTMGDPEYQRRYGFDIVETDIINIHGLLASDNPVMEKQRLVVGTHAMPRPDWVKTRVFGWMTSLLHFDKLLQIPLVLMNHLYGVSYRDLLERFCVGDLPPVLDELRQFFTDKALAIGAGDVEFCRSEQWLNIWWPADELAMIRLCSENRLDDFYAEAQQLLEQMLQEQGVHYYETVLKDALMLNRRLIKLPGSPRDLEVFLLHNIWEVYRGVLQGEPVGLKRGRFGHDIDRTSQQWGDWEQWAREVIWWGNKRGAYLYPCTIETLEQQPQTGIVAYDNRQQQGLRGRCLRDDRHQPTA